MKSIQIVPHIHNESSGPSHSVPNLAKALSELGVESEIVCLERGKEVEGAAIKAFHNRRASTLRCLNGLYKQVGISDINITTFVVFDGSTVGTSDAIKEKSPNVKILKGDGTLY